MAWMVFLKVQTFFWSTPKAWDREVTTEAWAAALQVLDLARASRALRIEELWLGKVSNGGSGDQIYRAFVM